MVLNEEEIKEFEDSKKQLEKKINQEDIYTYKFNGKEAKGIVTNDGFVLLKGSQLNSEDKFAERWREKLPAMRLIHADKISNDVTTADILFRSSSGAANFCSGQSISGPKCWLSSNNISLENRTKWNESTWNY